MNTSTICSVSVFEHPTFNTTSTSLRPSIRPRKRQLMCMSYTKLHRLPDTIYVASTTHLSFCQHNLYDLQRLAASFDMSNVVVVVLACVSIMLACLFTCTYCSLNCVYVCVYLIGCPTSPTAHHRSSEHTHPHAFNMFSVCVFSVLMLLSVLSLPPASWWLCSDGGSVLAPCPGRVRFGKHEFKSYHLTRISSTFTF